MDDRHTGPQTVFGISLKTIVVVAVCCLLLLVIVDRSDLERLREVVTSEAPDPPVTGPQPGEGPDIVVDEKMLSEAMTAVQLDRLAEVERAEPATPTDRFFYVVEIVGGSDIEAVDVTIEPDRVIMLSEGGTETTVARSMVKNIQRFKLPPSQEKR